MSCTQSTTQSNEERTGSYDRYFAQETLDNNDDLESTAAPGDHGEGASHDQRSLLSDDTGAVKFDLSDRGEGDAPSSPSRDTGAVDSGLGPPSRSNSQAALGPQIPPPETPANPFAGRNMGAVAPPSELFKQTQYSSAVQARSPTSSRPSPDMFPNNSISPNPPPVSSPLKRRDPALNTSPPGFTSSPQLLPGTSSRPYEEAVTPVITGSSANAPEDPEIPESPQSRPPLQRPFSGPMDEYEPMRLSQQRRELSTLDGARTGDALSSDEDAFRRRKRIRSKRNAASNELRSLIISRKPSGEDDEVEVPSTNKKIARSRSPAIGQRRAARSRRKDPYELPETSSQEPQGSVANSQEPARPEIAASSREAIPETSPPDARQRRTQSRLLVRSSNPAIAPPSIPQVSSELADTQPPDLPPMKPAASSAVTDRTQPFSPSTSEIGAAADTSTRHRKEHGDTPLAPRSSAPSLAPPTSALTSLTGTPNISSSTTPGTEVSRKSMLSSPADAKARRRNAAQSLPQLDTGSVASGRVTRRSIQRSPPSTDELARSETPFQEHNLRASRLGRLSTLSVHDVVGTETPARPPKIFDGMVFAVSFQSNKKNDGVEYNGKTELAATVEKKIRQAGGRVLESGFDELFEPLHVENAASSPADASHADPDIKLTAAAARSFGFAALIADGHSRKTKYMQALALGLPCLSARWVVTCVERNEVVDWAPYLLCAGQSSFLGDAIRSRNLVPYDATTAVLQEVVERRPRLLKDSNILLAMKPSDKAKQKPYIFLVRALGASLTSVATADEARARLKAMEDLGRPYDWVYVDERTDKSALFDPAPTASVSKSTDKLSMSLTAGGRKRKRAGAVAASAPTSMIETAGSSPKKIRTLSNELVIQSLILGRLIEASEMQE